MVMTTSLPADDHDSLLEPGFATRFRHELLSHSAHLPIAILIVEWLLAPAGYFLRIDPYQLLIAALAQAFFLAQPLRPSPRWLFFGNLIGPALYSSFEFAHEGWAFIQQPQHWAYWDVSLAFAVLQSSRRQWPRLAQPALLLENIIRALAPVLIYALFELGEKPDWMGFFEDSAHVYLTLVVILLGLTLGLADINRHQISQALAEKARQLHQLSSWGFGRHVVADALTNARSIEPQRRKRAVLFMDIRGFTAWSEPRSPEAVVAMLDEFYAAATRSLRAFSPTKIKVSADEVMAVFVDSRTALVAAGVLRKQVHAALAPYQLAAGMGLHAGPLVEGLMGSEDVKNFDVIGDAVNTAARLCANAGAGELLVSESLLKEIGMVGEQPARLILAKGKREPVAARVLESNDVSPVSGQQ